MIFIKKLTGNENGKSSGCCVMEIKEVEEIKEESYYVTFDNSEKSSCCKFFYPLIKLFRCKPAGSTFLIYTKVICPNKFILPIYCK